MTTKTEIQLSRLQYALLARITELHDTFRRKGALAKDGSFFQTNEQLSKWLHCSELGLIKARRRLIEAGKIEHQAIAVKGKASLYWICNRVSSNKQEIHMTWITQSPLTPEEVKGSERFLGRDRTIEKYKDMGYAIAQIIAALGEPK